MPCRWILDDTPLPGDLPRIAQDLSISEVLASILHRRGLETPQAMDLFLSPHLRHLCRPEAVPGLSGAAEAVARAVQAGTTIAVWGDYDVDGITSTALLTTFFLDRGIQVLHRIPHRVEEGYGLNVEGLRGLADQGAGLVLTVDCGISNHQEIEAARDMGLAVVVTDHHLPGAGPPPAEAVANPKLGECPCPDLAGVGVAFMLAGALNSMLPGEPMDLRELLDLAALGTIADVVPLTGPNRILVKNGLLMLKTPHRPGITALKEAAGYAAQAPLGAGQVAFGLAPRINAAGRLDDPNLALDLLLAPDMDTARPLAAKLDELNAQRRSQEEAMIEQALEQAKGQMQRVGLVLFQEDWHPGVMGIAASRVVERLYRPTVLLGAQDGSLTGSGRSIAELDLHRALADSAELLSRFGGHKQAAGLALAPDNLEAFRERFHQAVADQVGEEPLTPSLKVDQQLGFEAVAAELLREMDLLQPFGAGNPEPVFASPPVDVLRYRIFGKNHVGLDLKDAESGRILQAKAWRQAEELTRASLTPGMRFAFTPRLDTFQGVPRVELRIRDWKR
jgi:single-stranded-DNA-specific exonuclease